MLRRQVMFCKFTHNFIVKLSFFVLVNYNSSDSDKIYVIEWHYFFQAGRVFCMTDRLLKYESMCGYISKDRPTKMHAYLVSGQIFYLNTEIKYVKKRHENMWKFV